MNTETTLGMLVTALPDINSSWANDSDLGTVAPTKFIPRSALNYGELQNYWAYRTALKVTKNKYYFLVPFSLICNLFCFAVLFKRMTRTSAYMFMANIALWDAATIFMRGTAMTAFTEGWDVGDTGCTIIGVLLALTSPVAEWLVILLTADRCIAVWFPFKHRQICSMPLALALYAFVVIMMLGVICDHFWTVYGVSYPPFYYCMFKQKYDDLTQRFHWAYLAFQSFIPTGIMILLNVLLVYKVRKQLGSMSHAKSTSGKSKKMSTENHVTMMALAIAISFVFLVCPFCGFTAATYLWDYDKDLDTYVTYAVVQCVVFILYDLNHCLNVFFYFLSGAKFRSDALQMITCGKRGGSKHTTNGGKVAMSQATSVSTIS